MTTDTKIAATSEERQLTPAEMRAEAARLIHLADIEEGEAAESRKGCVYISLFGAAYIHDGSPTYDTICDGSREASVHEVDALYAAIPEFAVRLDEVRGQA